MDRPMTSWPCRASKAAATDESTPPDMATTMRIENLSLTTTKSQFPTAQKIGASGRGFPDRDLVAECLQLAEAAELGSFPVAAVEVVGAELFVRQAITHDEIRNFEDLMRNRHHGLLVTTMPPDAEVARLQGRALRAHGAQAAFDQRRLQIAVALAGPPAAPFARRFILPGTDRPPAAQMPRGGEAAHIP